MGKASSSKKVARAARAGGSASADQRKLGFPAALLAIFVLGTGLVVFSRAERTAADPSPSLSDHWHYAYGIYTCDTFEPGLVDAEPDRTGIHTHQDGIIHIHPFSSSVTGDNAVFGEFTSMTGVTLEDDSFTLPDGRTFANGDDCNGEPGRVVVARWPADDPDADPVLFESDFGDVNFVEDRGQITLAFLPEGEAVPRPPSVSGLDNLTDVVEAPGDATSDATIDPSAVPTDPTVAPGDTTPGDTTPGDTTAGDATTTTAAVTSTTAP